MRVRGIILAALLVSGCTVAHKPHQAVAPLEAVPAAYEEAPSVALVFDTPLPEGQRPIELTRDERQPSAFVGFDGPITTSFWIYTDDLQEFGGGGIGRDGNRSGGNGDRYQREAIMEQTGVRTR